MNLFVLPVSRLCAQIVAAAAVVPRWLRNDPAIGSAACEYAKTWAGARLAGRVQTAADASAGDWIAGDVLVAIAVAVIIRSRAE